MKIIVIGGGLMGVTSAHALSTRGHQVILLDQMNDVALGTSYANGGQLSWSHIDPLANSGIWSQLPSLLLGLDNSVELHALNLNLISWGLRFLAQCRPSRERLNMEKLFRLSMFSHKAHHKLSEQHCFDYHYQSSGKLILLSTQQSLMTATKKQPFRSSIGCHAVVLKADECVALEPTIAPIRHRITGGLHLPMNASGDSQLFCTQLAEYCKQAGVRFDLNCQVRRIIVDGSTAIGVETDSGELTADAVVIAAGMGSLALAHSAGLKLPLLPVKGYSLSLPIGAQAPTLSITDIQHKTVYSQLGNSLRVAGIHQIGAGNLAVDNQKIKQLLAMAKACFPNAANYNANANGWAGLRPTTPDGVPVIGQTPIRNLWLNTGQGMLGWTLACGSAELLGGLIDQQPPSSLLAEDYSLKRF